MKMAPLPQIDAPLATAGWNEGHVVTWDWSAAVPLPPFTLADGSGPARQQTAVRLCYDAAALYVRFDCADRDIWGTYTRRDDPIYDEEVVEVFLAPGATVPKRYAEVEVSPNGVLFDAWVRNPTGDRAQMQVDVAWDWPGIRWHVTRRPLVHAWTAVLVLPWAGFRFEGPRPSVWRANFYRIERPRDGAPEYSCWSSTFTEPADFHRPDRFGFLHLKEGAP